LHQNFTQLERAASPSAREAGGGDWPVALVSMPFMTSESPSIQLGLLKAIADVHNFPATTLHLSLDFAKQIGRQMYSYFSGGGAVMQAEWLFSVAALGEDAPDPTAAFLTDMNAQQKQSLADGGITTEELRFLREEAVPQYLDRLLETIPWEQFKVVGFTSTFAQNMASFALARRLKCEFPHIITLFGGANFDAEMGLEWTRVMNCVDYAVVGEGDQAFPEFLAALLYGRDPARVAGVVCRRNGAVTSLRTRPLFEELDALPVPDYSEFFARSLELGLASNAELRRARIPYESARGCWWGAKHHCTFCGLNKDTMPFRSKSTGRVLDELAVLSKRHRSFEFFAVDNILDPKYLADFFARIIAEQRDYRFFYEVKANLTRAQVKTLREGGVRSVQPGIESLSTHVLQLMRKGVTAIQNVNLLRWAQYYGIEIHWNLLYGFPGETEEDYQRQATLMPHLVHLQPPNNSASRIAMQRFSPIFTDRETFPARMVRPAKSFDYIYPRSVNFDCVAYYFDYELEKTLPDSAFDELHEQARSWRQAWKEKRRPKLNFNYSPGVLEIEDRRKPEAPRAISTAEPLASLYAACSDQPHTAARLQKDLGLNWSVARVEQGLMRFVSQGLMMRDGNQFLSLALPESPWR
jgi:ribosomal peptide maturation radical SAM protein 1